LPTNKEWQQAALGTADPAGKWGVDDCNVADNWPNNPGRAGSAKNCVSAAGVYDMIGNVWEWVEGNVEDGRFGEHELPAGGYIGGVGEDGMPVATSQEAGDENYYFDYFWVKGIGVKAIARGGYWDNRSDAGQYSAYIVLSPSEIGPGIGFRCVK
jgi:formylglycine-generating enzyme required for sulfatase activity